MKFDLKNIFGKKPPVSDNEMDKMRQTLRESQREFEHQSRKYEAEMTKLRDLVARAALLEKDTADYRNLQHQAIACKQKADAYEKGMKTAYSVLEKNRKFESMLENGMTLSRLNGMIPSPDAAEKLLQEISDVAEEFHDKQEELDDLMREFDESINELLPSTDESAFAEFDALVNAEKEKNAKKEVTDPVQPAVSAEIKEETPAVITASVSAEAPADPAAAEEETPSNEISDLPAESPETPADEQIQPANE